MLTSVKNLYLGPTYAYLSSYNNWREKKNKTKLNPLSSSIWFRSSNSNLRGVSRTDKEGSLQGAKALSISHQATSFQLLLIQGEAYSLLFRGKGG